jgi:hypothetical protein
VNLLEEDVELGIHHFSTPKYCHVKLLNNSIEHGHILEGSRQSLGAGVLSSCGTDTDHKDPAH